MMKNVKKISLDSIYKPKDEESISRENKLREVRSAAIQHIGIANKSSGLVRTFLGMQAFDPELIEETIDELINEGYIDDLKIAQRIIRERSAGKSESLAALRIRLIRQGVAEQVIDQLDIQMTDDDTSAAELVRKRLTKEMQLFVRADREVKRKILGKMNRFLQSHGYSSECARKAILSALADIEQENKQN